jgi:hypothetical protein
MFETSSFFVHWIIAIGHKNNNCYTNLCKTQEPEYKLFLLVVPVIREAKANLIVVVAVVVAAAAAVVVSDNCHPFSDV